MNKVKLNLDALNVDSFETSVALDELRGNGAREWPREHRRSAPHLRRKLHGAGVVRRALRRYGERPHLHGLRLLNR